MPQEGPLYEPLAESKGQSAGCCGQCCGACCGVTGKKVWLVSSLVLVFSWCICEFLNKQWEIALEDKLAEQTQIAHTKLGDVEYYKTGSAPYVMVIHGQMGGWDLCTVPVVVQPWINAGYGLICPSRAGYLRSPLPKYPMTAQDQAHLLAALLDTLNVDKVVVTGGSAGGPTIYAMGLEHPERVTAIIPLVAISKAKAETPDSPMCCVDKDGNFPLFPAQLMTSLMTDATVNRLIAMGMTDVKASLTSGMIQMSSMTPKQQADEILRVEANKTLAYSAHQILLKTVLPFTPRWPGNLNDMYAQTFMELDLSKITVPTLIVHDEWAGANGVPLSYGQYAHREIPNSELIIVPKAWHIIWLADAWSDAMNKQVKFAKDAAAKR